MLKIRNLYVVLARDISTDVADQMNSIIKIIDRFGFGYDPTKMKEQGMTLGEKPILFPAKYAIATSWYFGELLKSDTFLTFGVSVKDPDGQDFGGPTQEHLLPVGIDRINMNFSMEGLPVTKAGTYTLAVTVSAKDGKKLANAEYPFSVELTEQSHNEKPQKTNLTGF